MMRSVQMPAIDPMDPEVIKAFIQGFNDKKAELIEAVCVKPRGGSDFGRLSKFVKDAILNEDWLE